VLWSEGVLVLKNARTSVSKKSMYEIDGEVGLNTLSQIKTK